MMRLGWAKTKYSISYFVQKTIRVNGKNKSQVVKRLGSEKYICKTYGVTDAKAWAKEQGCTEFASDCELTNTVSQEFHKKLGFEEANRVVCFVKKF